MYYSPFFDWLYRSFQYWSLKVRFEWKVVMSTNWLWKSMIFFYDNNYFLSYWSCNFILFVFSNYMCSQCNKIEQKHYLICKKFWHVRIYLFKKYFLAHANYCHISCLHLSLSHCYKYTLRNIRTYIHTPVISSP